MFTSNIAIKLSSRLICRSEIYPGCNRRESQVSRRWKLYGEWRLREAKIAGDRYATFGRHAKCYMNLPNVASA